MKKQPIILLDKPIVHCMEQWHLTAKLMLTVPEAVPAARKAY